ncbi:hypothetical protein Q7P37_003218 [Cladosporium fusiforme]
MSEQSSLSPGQELPNPRKNIIQSVLDGHVSAETAAPKLAAVSLPDPNGDMDEMENNISAIWDTLLVFLQQDPSCVKVIADLIFYISHLPPVLTNSGAQLIMNECLHVWRDCPFLGLSLREEMNNDITTEQPARQRAIEYYVARNALYAILMNYDESRFHHGSSILWTFRDSLEYPLNAPRGDGGWAMDCYIPAAAKLVEIAGPRISAWHYEYESGPRVGDRGKGGPLWSGMHGFCKERWLFWRKRLFDLAHETQLDNALREEARKAGEIMENIG